MTTRARTRASLAAILALVIGLGTSVAVVSSAAADAAPAVTVTPTIDVDPATDTTFTVSGTGFTGAGAANGVYVALGASAVWSPGTVPPADGWLAFAWVQPADLVDGAFSTTLTVPAATFDPAGSYGVATFAAHELSATDRTLDSFTAITLAAVVEPEPEPDPTPTPTAGISVTPTADVADGSTVTVTGAFPATVTATAGATSGTALTTGLYVLYCAEPAGTVGTAGGRASGTLCDTTKQQYIAASPGPAGATVIGSVVDGWWTFTTTVVVDDAFGTHTCEARGTEQCGIFVRLYHGFNGGNLTNPYVYDQFVPVTFPMPPAAPSIVTLAVTPASGAVAGTAVALTATVAPTVAGTFTFFAGASEVAQVAAVTGVATHTYADLAVGDTVLRAVFTPDDTVLTQGSEASIPFTIVSPPTQVQGSLTWGVKASFRSYVAGPIAQGSISTTGASTSGNSFVFGQSSGGSFDGSTGTANYAGSVRFAGHSGLLDLTLSNPSVTVDSPTAGTLFLSVNGGGPVAFATLSLGAGNRTNVGGAVLWSDVPASLTSTGAGAFSFNGSPFYGAGTALDPVSFVVGAPSTAGGGTSTVASFAGEREPAAAPPATTGLTVTSGDPVAGDQITVTADGFQPNESGILVVIYSDPVVLARDVTADASGTVTWSGRLPAGLTGEHTLTLQGSVSRGVVLDIAPNVATAAAGCPVDDASLVWGFKESFRSYISGTIANGEWTVADGATYETPNFSWPAGEGSYDAETGEGLVAFLGSITFTGHGGILNTMVSNPRLEFVDADTAIVIVDVTGTTQEGEPVSETGVQFVELDLTDAATLSDNELVVTDAPATLTPVGAAAFGTYSEGEEFDPVSFTLALDPACAVAAPTDTVDAEPTSGANLWWIWLIVALVIAAVVAVVLMRRRAA